MDTAAGVALWCIFLLICGAMVGAFLRVWKCPSRRGGHQWRLVKYRLFEGQIKEETECMHCSRRQVNWY